jgi:hypothetical protein
MHLAELVHDAVTLAELQVELLKVDLRDARQRVTLALALLGLGTVLALGCIPVLLFAAAQGLVVGLGWPAPLAYLAIGAAAAVVAGVLVWIGARRAAGAMGTVQRSKSEFAETLRWFKGSLRQTERSELDDEMNSELWTSRSGV